MSCMRSLTVISVLAGLVAIPALCHALPPRQGGYISAFVGASTPQDMSITINEFNPVSVRNTRVEFDPGFNVGASAGYEFGLIRLEGEMSYKNSDLTKVAEPATGTRYVNVDGNLGTFSMLMNCFVQLPNDSLVTPYLGGGMGFAVLDLSSTRGVDATLGAINNHIFSSDQDTVFAYQAGGGMEVALNRKLSLDLGYRYLGTGQASLRKDWPNSTDLKLGSHNAQVGLRVRF